MGGLKLPIFNLSTSCLLRTLVRKLNSLSLLNVRPISAFEEHAVIETQLLNLLPSQLLSVKVCLHVLVSEKASVLGLNFCLQMAAAAEQHYAFDCICGLAAVSGFRGR